MWLQDRFSGSNPNTPAASPPPQNRAYSPAPRGSSHLTVPQQRPSLNAQPTLSGLTSPSNISLQSVPRAPNGSSLKQELTPPPNVPDPLDVLRSILGAPRADDAPEGLPRWLVKDIDFGDGSLQDFVETGGPPTQPPEAQPSLPFRGYHAERRKFQDFHTSISRCDDVLNSVETYLTKFQAELGQVSAEIENLQSRSVEMNTKLENRKKVEHLLGPAVEEISISPLTVRTIAEGPVDENWIRALKELESRLAAVEAKTRISESTKALEDVRPLLNDLKAKAVERIRDFIVAQIKALRSPNINAQILQQQTFLRYKDLYAFIGRNHKDLAEEIGQAYVNTMRWYYSHNFGRYQSALQAIQVYAIDQNDLLGSDQAAVRRANLPAHDVFNIGRRADVLKSTNTAISSYLASETKSPQYMETVFSNFNLTLIDNVCFEYFIDSDLFSTKTFHQVSRRSAEIFDPVFTLGQTLTKSLVEYSTDCLGVLLCVRLNQHFAFQLQRRKAPVAESYINATNMLLWPRFQRIMDLHCESLRKVATSTSAARNATNAALSLVGGSNSTDTSRSSSLAPHLITQRFGQFLHGILTLSSETGDDEPVSNSLNRLRNEYDALMTKLSKSVGGDQRKRQRFLENQYSLVLTIVGEVEGKMADEMRQGLEEKLGEARGR